MANKIVTLQNTDKTEGKLPRTVLKAIFDDNGDYLDPELTADDINALKDGAITSLSTWEDISSSVSLSDISGSIKNTYTLNAYTNGLLVYFTLSVETNGSVPVGSNIFSAKINGLPPRNVRYVAVDFNSASITTLLTMPNDTLICRVLANGAVSGMGLVFTQIMAINS